MNEIELNEQEQILNHNHHIMDHLQHEEKNIEINNTNIKNILLTYENIIEIIMNHQKELKNKIINQEHELIINIY